ncbi:MAG: hypothetical protein JST87_19490 [Bacteroidetes bacterium]|nr:hypothetical protein [Bacteroidota bacterium]
MKFIDSINSSNNLKNISYNRLIDDGEIEKNGKIVGGYGIYVLSNLKNDTVFRIEYNGGVNITVNKTYYYKFNKLIFARLQLISSKKGIGKIYDKAEYYTEGKIVSTIVQKEKNSNRYSAQINLSLFQDGMQLLDDFNKDKNRR